jgi:hypothetical protein
MEFCGSDTPNLQVARVPHGPPPGQMIRPDAGRTQGEHDCDAGRKWAGARNSRSPTRDIRWQGDGRQEQRGIDRRSPARESTWGRGDKTRSTTLVGATTNRSPPRWGGLSTIMQVLYITSKAVIPSSLNAGGLLMPLSRDGIALLRHSGAGQQNAR